MTTVAVKVWDKQGGRKFTRKFYLTVNKGIAPSVKEMFKEIYKSKERFPIHEMGCYNWRGNSSTSEHCLGLAFDINSYDRWEKSFGRFILETKEKQIFHTIKLQIGKNIRKIRF